MISYFSLEVAIDHQSQIAAVVTEPSIERETYFRIPEFCALNLSANGKTR